MSDLLTAAAESMGTPSELVSRSAEARAAANGTTADEILSAWSGGTPAASASPPPVEEESPAEEPVSPEPEVADREPEPLQELSPVMVAANPEPATKAAPEVTLEPVDLSHRLRTAGRVGIWTGAVLGLFAFVVATAFWSQNATVVGEDQLRPVLIASTTGVLIGVGLVSVLFGAMVAALSRAAASWVNPAMGLSSSKASTAWIGAVLGLFLGLGAGAALANGFGTPIEGSEGLVQLPVMATLGIMLIGGALLGWLTAIVTQFFGTPVAVEGDEAAEVAEVKGRLRNAVGIPVAGLVILLLLVLPLAWALIESNHLTSGGGAVIAIIAASGILGFATLAGSRPNMKIGRGELLVAVAGIGLVIVIIFAVLSNAAGESPEADSGEAEAAIHTILG